MTPQRRIALASAVAAAGLIGVKLGVGLETGSLGFVSEAIHSASDLVAAALTFFAVGVAGRPADRGHQYGHGKAEHLAALGEAAILIGASLFVVVEAATRLASNTHPIVETPWYAFAVVAGVIAVDLSRPPGVGASVPKWACSLRGSLQPPCTSRMPLSASAAAGTDQ